MISPKTAKLLSVGGFFKVKLLKTVDSTNDFLKALPQNEAREGLVVVADEQTRGKGRLSRKFYSPKGGLYFSVLLRPNSQEVLSKLTVLAGVCVCDAVRKVCGDDASIKWVNDVLIGDKKCSGILVETTENLKGFAIVGIGVNIGDDNIDDSLKDIACGVTDRGKNTRFELLAEILENLKARYADFNATSVVEEYKSRCSTLGRRVKVLRNDGQEYFAIAKDVGADCRLKIEKSDGSTEFLDSGEIKILIS
ncbi:MAG: biotin--[Clostridia bacterium]|nr:biotin--[acetyl-CoA-carboxylase] ligase [Clostridia bacterium]